MTQPTSRITSPPLYSMLRSTSVVITRHDASGLITVSPVINPTSLNSACSSLYFWFDRAFSGLVYTTRWPSRRLIAMAYSATTVFPAEVCAATITLSPCSITSTDFLWNVSSSNAYFLAGFSGSYRRAFGSRVHPGGYTTSCRHPWPAPEGGILVPPAASTSSMSVFGRSGSRSEPPPAAVEAEGGGFEPSRASEAWTSPLVVALPSSFVAVVTSSLDASTLGRFPDAPAAGATELSARLRAAGDILASATGGTDLARAARSGVAWTRRVVVAISEEESAAAVAFSGSSPTRVGRGRRIPHVFQQFNTVPVRPPPALLSTRPRA